MKLYLTRCVSACAALFLIHDECGAHCCTVRPLSGLLSDGFQITGTFGTEEAVVYVSQFLLPHGRRFSIQVGGQRRARVFLLPDGRVHSIRLDQCPCKLLGSPLLGEYTLTDESGAILFTQKLQLRQGTATTYELTIPDDACAPVCVGIAICLSRNLTIRRGIFAAVPTD